MRRLLPLCGFFLLLSALIAAAQDDRVLRSGPQEGKFLPEAFDCYNFNGPHKGRYHCIVCRYGLNPAVLVFARELEKDKDANLNLLLKRLDDAVGEYKKHEFHAAVVFLSPDAKTQTPDAKVPDGEAAAEEAKRLVDEAKRREDLFARMAARAENLKGVDLGVYAAEGPKEYKLNPKAEVTVILYSKLKVVMNRAFGPQGLSEDDVDKIMARVKEVVEPGQKK